MAAFHLESILKPNRILHAAYAHTRGILGTGVCVAVLDTGITPRWDFSHRILYFKDFIHQHLNPYDDSGHGSHICGKIASNAHIPEYGSEYLGVAPNCNLVVLKILDSKGNTSIPVFLEAIEWLADNYQAYHIQIVNISIGANTSLSYLDSHLLIQAVERLWDLGLTVCTSAGNNGPSPGSITSPGTSCKVITVGASDDERSGSGYQQGYSGRGPLACYGLKPELVAPGNQIISCSNSPYGYSVKTGTSMSTALVSGAIALLLEQRPAMTNEEIKLHLRNSTRRLNLPHFQQGYGLLDIRRLLADT